MSQTMKITIEPSEGEVELIPLKATEPHVYEEARDENFPALFAMATLIKADYKHTVELADGAFILLRKVPAS
jgi:hypothetical protein